MTFDDVLTIKNGKNQRAVENANGRYPIYGSGGIMGYADDYICNPDTVIIGRKGNINKPIFVEEPFWNVDTAFGLEADKSVLLPKYLFYFCLKYDFERHNKAVTIPSLTKADLLKIEIELPSLKTQEDIVNQLDAISRTITLREEQLSKCDDLIKARFVELFGDKKYKKKQLIELIKEGEGLSYGIVVPGDNVPDGIPMVRPSDYKNGSLNLDNVYRVASDIECKYKKTRLIGDEILVQVIGQPGQVMLSDERCKGMNVTRNLAVVRIDKDKAERLFISHYLTTEEAQRFMFGSTNQSTLKQLPLNKLKKLPVPQVPLSEQGEFADFIKQVDKSKVAVQKSLVETQLLFDSLMQKYFG